MARRALGPATLRLVTELDRVLGAADGSLLVACSGGADSLALAAAAVRVGARRALPVAAVVVDHGLQPGSATVAGDAVATLQRLGVDEAMSVRVVVPGPGAGGPESAARAARYAALEQEAARRGATVLLGHTLDDQAETVLLGLARGSGTRSLAGMPARHGCFLRPLLRVRRADTHACCAELGLTPWRDPHNGDDRFTRVRVRDRVLPVLEDALGPGVAEALARTAEAAAADADLLDTLAAAADPGGDELDCGRLAALDPALRRRVLLRWLRRRGAPDVASVHLLAVERLVADWHGQRGVDVPGLRVVRRDGRLLRGP